MALTQLNLLKMRNSILRFYPLQVVQIQLLQKQLTLKEQIYDSDQVKVKISNPSKNISPIEVPMEIIKQDENRPIEFQGEITFGFSGEWLVEVGVTKN